MMNCYWNLMRDLNHPVRLQERFLKFTGQLSDFECKAVQLQSKFKASSTGASKYLSTNKHPNSFYAIFYITYIH